ncbi:MAG: EAL domain-containing protein [Planctomycetota bacterium]
MFEVVGHDMLDRVGLAIADLRRPDQNSIDAVLIEEGVPADPWAAAPLPVVLERMRSPWFPAMLEQRTLEFEYQPILEIDGDGVFGYEAFLRGNVDGISIGAQEVLLAADAHGCLKDLDRVAREAAIEQGAQIVRRGHALFVNFLPLTVADPIDGLSSTFATIDRSALDPDRIVLELVGCQIASDVSHASSMLEKYRDLGLRISVDDFEGDIRSLDMIDRLRPEFVKLSASIVAQSLELRECGLLRAIVDRVHESDTLVIAKNVETREAADTLRDIGFDALQGWFVGRPHPVDIAEAA